MFMIKNFLTIWPCHPDVGQIVKNFVCFKPLKLNRDIPNSSSVPVSGPYSVAKYILQSVPPVCKALASSTSLGRENFAAQNNSVQ